MKANDLFRIDISNISFKVNIYRIFRILIIYKHWFVFVIRILFIKLKISIKDWNISIYLDIGKYW